jgi:hypothetical protein
MDHPGILKLDIKIKTQIKIGIHFCARYCGLSRKIDSAIQAEFNLSGVEFIAEQERNNYLAVGYRSAIDNN